ncbi:S-fimbrial protein subunit SfaG precursor [Serratia quinivorans]|nr:fimbrial protein [Serratia quinivorans]CAI1103444.1 S-fimbrial protein subunit SfaG precursor [Serratia quinivorans]CAI1163825.1 S-fimbrial protein subunit SfaG precursor [Serratia quinivorans]CAI1908650.1 S-fimbrial protein subunit SfaG precursor [Serratia quinivorans]CAI2143768.1 S-fimbrial protein subunit SfaG precursor [Serratia quinivorans]CAI2501751.1 S-fimbrial protein subunit SfaG precursor [Serratia quinivorans]
MKQAECRSDRAFSRHRQQYRWCLMSMIAMGPLVLAMGWSLLPNAQATTWEPNEYSEVEGASGVLFVSGALTESACRLDMDSAYQSVHLGTVGTGELLSPGSRGQPVGVKLKLRDCLRMSGQSLDERGGNLTWSTSQPAVSVSFMAPADQNNTQLVQVEGAKGLGLRLLDAQQHDVRLGSRGAPLLLNPGQSTLTYTVMPERTSAPLQPDAYHATVNFRMNYD